MPFEHKEHVPIPGISASIHVPFSHSNTLATLSYWNKWKMQILMFGNRKEGKAGGRLDHACRQDTYFTDFSYHIYVNLYLLYFVNI